MKATIAIEPGSRFGKWTVIEKDISLKKDAHIYWKCQCECGNIKSIRSTSLRNGKSTSCGCEHGYIFSTGGADGSCKKIDLTNQRFGSVVALYPTSKRSGSHIVWHCKCDCGKEFDTDGHSLRKGLTESCGCRKFSKGEQKIANLLEVNNIPFEQEKIFDTCIFTDSDRKARFDFYVNNQYLIEFDGPQHYNAAMGWNKTEEEFQKIQAHDKYKNNWCKANNIPLIRIPYSKLFTLTIQDLKLETSNFII